jgi:SSS family solute:Na+ symporter
LLSRAAIVLVLLLSALVAVLLPSAVINEFGYMSMGLRACVIFAPLCAALWFPGRISAKFAVLSIIISPVVDLVFGMIKVLPFDSLFAGMFASLIVMGAGFMSKAGFFSKKR